MQFYVTTDSSILSSVKRMSRPGSSFAKRTVLWISKCARACYSALVFAVLATLENIFQKKTD